MLVQFPVLVLALAAALILAGEIRPGELGRWAHLTKRRAKRANEPA